MSTTAQVEFWRSSFGDDYVDRSQSDAGVMDSRVAMWRHLLASMVPPPASVLEVGANIGLNLRAIADLLPAELHAVEPNAKARALLAESGVMPAARILDGAGGNLPFDDGAVELAFTCGVLIHVAPTDLPDVCREIHRVSSRFVVCAEYFNAEPVEIPYRGHSGMLFKRDFGAFWMDGFADLRLVDYGFLWKRATGLDNLTWWIFEKRQG